MEFAQRKQPKLALKLPNEEAYSSRFEKSHWAEDLSRKKHTPVFFSHNGFRYTVEKEPQETVDSQHSGDDFEVIPPPYSH